MASTSEGPVGSKLLHSSGVRRILIAITFAISVSAIIATLFGIFEQAGQLAAVASAFATILLVSLTAQYAQMTQRLAEEAESDREQRKEFRKEEQEREIMALRRGLHEEIGKVRTYEDYVEKYETGMSIFQIPAPNTVYESNAGRIGLLEDEEVDLIVEYYTRLDHIQTEIETQRKLDTTFEMGLAREFYERYEGILNYLARKLTGGRYGQPTSKNREKRIRRLFKDLVTAQSAALEAIESNLDTESE
ncbi:hypothetical protein [Halorubrum sp. DM2]|uniref:hypothetical protein n=1 Tax=Halorubrum sp. DM2 TaxID=2527867 RepID=UPI0024B846C6|nr:hypothetical protein [Halorubrum sp. DM2]